MKAVLITDFGGPEHMTIGESPVPIIGDEEILVKVKATALNRADILQRKGLYPPPPGASPVLGLEMSGIIDTVGKEVKNWKPGDRVFGLLPGGGYAEYVSIHMDMAIAIPENLSFVEAAAIPEVFLTAYQAISWLAQFQASESIMIHAGASGVGTAGIQMAREMGADQVIITASAPKHKICIDLGANIAIDYKTQDFESIVKEYTNGRGVNVIIDFMAAPYFQNNINTLGLDGRMVMLALMGGVKATEVNLANILRKRLKIMGSTLRARSLGYKIDLTRDFADFALPRFKSGKLKPVIDSVYDWKDVGKAHRFMEENKNKGKIILEITE